jgi:hypothetical protein
MPARTLELHVDETLVDTERLAQLETVIGQNLKAFIRVGNALMEIQEAKLYKKTHNSFEEYCRQRWQIERAHAYRLIDSAKVAQNLSPIGDIQPTHESQVRPLAKLEPEQQREAWKEATTKNSNPTAQDVQEAVSKAIEADAVETPVPRWNQPDPEPVVDDPATERTDIPDANLVRLAEKILEAALHYAPGQEVDVARSLLRMIFRKFPELRGCGVK